MKYLKKPCVIVLKLNVYILLILLIKVSVGESAEDIQKTGVIGCSNVNKSMSDHDTRCLDVNLNNITDEEKMVDVNQDTSRGKKKELPDFLPFIIVPALMLAGIMPWIIPPLKTMVMIVGFINQFAFSQALFTLIRNYVFSDKKEEHVIYLNHGYNKH